MVLHSILRDVACCHVPLIWDVSEVLGASRNGLCYSNPIGITWLDKSPVKSIRYKGILSRWALRLFVVSFFVLGWLGVMPATKTYTIMAQFFTLIYFAYFVLMPWYTTVEATKPEPERVT